MWTPTKSISEESLVIGALEAAFWETDQQIGEEKKVYSMPGGCTVLVALFILGKLYVANAGDCKGVLLKKQSDGTLQSINVSKTFSANKKAEQDRLKS